jgi:hypothetical protein
MGSHQIWLSGKRERALLEACKSESCNESVIIQRLIDEGLMRVIHLDPVKPAAPQDPQQADQAEKERLKQPKKGFFLK